MVFTIELLKASDEQKVSCDVATAAFRDILPDMIEHLSLRPAQSRGNKQQKMGYGLAHTTTDSENIEIVTKDSQNIADILCKCQALGLTSEVDQIISQVLVEIHNISIEHLNSAILGFLEKVLNHLLTQRADRRTSFPAALQTWPRNLSRPLRPVRTRKARRLVKRPVRL
jgi:hypothetical protein